MSSGVTASRSGSGMRLEWNGKAVMGQVRKDIGEVFFIGAKLIARMYKVNMPRGATRKQGVHYATTIKAKKGSSRGLHLTGRPRMAHIVSGDTDRGTVKGKYTSLGGHIEHGTRYRLSQARLYKAYDFQRPFIDDKIKSLYAGARIQRFT